MYSRTFETVPLIACMRKYNWFFYSIQNSYSQIFFSNNVLFAVIIFLVTFYDLYTGLYGLVSVLTTTIVASLIGFNREKIKQGYYGFNALLVGLGLGVNFESGYELLIIVLLAALLSLFISVSMEGVIGKYALPYLSLPFVFAIWVVTLATRELTFLQLNERGIYIINDLYHIGGQQLVDFYTWWNAIPFPVSLKIYFSSLSSIFFQYSTFTGILIAIGLLIYSRIAFTLSLLGFYTAFLFYSVAGVEFSEAAYSFIGFNYILTAIAIGGFFTIPSIRSYLWVIFLIPITTLLTLSISSFLNILFLPVYSLPFNAITLLFLYVLKFRDYNSYKLNTVTIQQHSPEKNLYAHLNFIARFGHNSPITIGLPFYGEWVITQASDGKYTHQGDWKHAWDFEIKDNSGKTYKEKGDFPENYFCFDKNVIAPADGIVIEIFDDVEDNIIGEKNLKQNWGNTVILKHSEFLFSQLSHLKAGSICVEAGQKVTKGSVLGKCGNSGNSPFPHLHFQLQETPFLGSKTIRYPISNFLQEIDDQIILKTVGFPKEKEVIFGIVSDPVLKNAFQMVAGETFEFIRNDNTEKILKWEVKTDYYLNTYIECARTGSKAWFFYNDSMFHFTHFEGRPSSELYHFYLAAYSVCLGKQKKLAIKDSFPLNMVFGFRKMFFQDFFAPFFRWKKVEYKLNYPHESDPFSSDNITLQSEIIASSMFSKKRIGLYNIEVSSQGLHFFEINSSDKSIRLECIKH